MTFLRAQVAAARRLVRWNSPLAGETCPELVILGANQVIFGLSDWLSAIAHGPGRSAAAQPGAFFLDALLADLA
jgi:hypothetical protein